jgi:tRNA(fMet)-specific endonuclease VapC
MAPVRYILDTDSVTYQQLGRAVFIQRLAQIDPATVATTIITLSEQMRGRLAAVNRQQDDAALQIAYQRLQATHAYYCQIPIVSFDAEATAIYRRLVDQRLRIGAQDLKIAAIALAHAAVLVTSNRRHFDQVPGLQIEEWNV